jgi:hypothetical protein
VDHFRSLVFRLSSRAVPDLVKRTRSPVKLRRVFVLISTLAIADCAASGRPRPIHERKPRALAG